MSEFIEYDYKDWLTEMKKSSDVIEQFKLNAVFISHNSSNTFEIVTPANGLLILPPLKYSLNYGFSLKLISKYGIELSGDTKIKIVKIKTSSAIVPIDDLLYYNIRYGHPTMYHTVKPLELKSLERLQFIILGPCELDMEQSRLDAVMDVFMPNPEPVQSTKLPGPKPTTIKKKWYEFWRRENAK